MRLWALRRFLLAVLAALPLLSTTALAESPASTAAAELETGRAAADVVQNRFFVKTSRFEVSPVLGYVPNNPMVKRYVGGILFGYHLSESFAAEGALLYSPDLGVNDLKGLTITLVDIAHSGDADGQFQQPLDKMVLGASFAGRWAPVYGKINLLGEAVANFDLYGVGGIGMLSMAKCYARYDNTNPELPVALEECAAVPVVTGNAGVGLNFFLNQSTALKLEGRSYLYVGTKPDYDPDDGQSPDESRLYNNFIASVGLSFFLPKMQARFSDY